MIPIFRAKSNERKNTYVEGLLIGVDEELNLCTIRTRDDYIGGEVCYLHTLSINFPDMLDSQGNKIFASLNENRKGGDILIEEGRYEDGFNPIFEPYFRKSSLSIFDLPKTAYGEYQLKYYKIIGIQQ